MCLSACTSEAGRASRSCVPRSTRCRIGCNLFTIYYTKKDLRPLGVDLLRANQGLFGMYLMLPVLGAQEPWQRDMEGLTAKLLAQQQQLLAQQQQLAEQQQLASLQSTVASLTKENAKLEPAGSGGQSMIRRLAESTCCRWTAAGTCSEDDVYAPLPSACEVRRLSPATADVRGCAWHAAGRMSARACTRTSNT